MAKDHGPSIKDDARYEKLRAHGYSKAKSARIANTSRHTAAQRGGKAEDYEDQTRAQLYEKAKKIGIPGCSRMRKDELIHVLRHH
ncbi:MAG TPA: Rho termination factor N-terminal domain-containing protein [Candidatus Macondimonas sp.]|nr:Rho termination factor N-terminal domain-containing protein [Candidatus Macondimonas sp.]